MPARPADTNAAQKTPGPRGPVFAQFNLLLFLTRLCSFFVLKMAQTNQIMQFFFFFFCCIKNGPDDR
ncbi:hypothetical protein HanRHA438_Chr17g0791941 [Helianthus annuus]|nr:hypothetical protein HanRHA438_Chr17g0791941 [Helianthus annuus]